MKSIRRELTIHLLASLLVLVAVCGGILYASIRHVLRNEFDDALLAKARALATLVQLEKNGNIEFEFADEMMPAFAAKFRREHAERVKPEYFEIWYGDGRILRRSTSLRKNDLPKNDYQAGRHSFIDLNLPDRRPGRAVCFSFVPQNDPDDDTSSTTGSLKPVPATRMILTLANSREPLDHSMYRLALMLGGIWLLFPVGIALIVRWRVKEGLRPLAQLAVHAASVDPGNLDFRFPGDDLPAELMPINQRLNDLLERIESAFGRMEAAYARERRFNDNVTHELRTPIAELLSLAEVAMLCPDNREMSRKAVHETASIADQMSRLVSALLELSRGESGLDPVDLKPVDWGDEIGECWNSYAEQAQARNLNCRVDAPHGVTINADKILLQSVLSNLISNAISHSPEGGWIRIELDAAKGKARLAIRNRTDDLTPEDLPRLFESFWRKDKARTGTVHRGLGLALVKVLCERMGIAVTPSLADGHFSIELVAARGVSVGSES